MTVLLKKKSQNSLAILLVLSGVLSRHGSFALKHAMDGPDVFLGDRLEQDFVVPFDEAHLCARFKAVTPPEFHRDHNLPLTCHSRFFHLNYSSLFKLYLTISYNVSQILICMIMMRLVGRRRFIKYALH